jgi:hypothetical protein
MPILKIKDFSRFPAGITFADGPYCADNFRENFLIPYIKKCQENKLPIIIDMDGVQGYAWSWTARVFGGLIKINGYLPQFVNTFKIIANDDKFMNLEIETHIAEALYKNLALESYQNSEFARGAKTAANLTAQYAVESPLNEKHPADRALVKMSLLDDGECRANIQQKPALPENVKEALLLLDIGQTFALRNKDPFNVRQEVQKLRTHIDIINNFIDDNFLRG